MTRAQWLRLVIPGAVVLIVAALIGVLATDAAAGDNLVIAGVGPLVQHGAPVASLLTDLAGAVTLGGAILAGWVLREDRDRARALVIAAVAAGIWTLGQVVGMVFSYAVATGQSPGADRFGSDLMVYLGTDLGIWIGAALVCAAITTTLAATGSSTGLARGVTATTSLGLFATAMTGHASGGDSHEAATSTMFVHLLAVGVWVGGLLVLQLLPATSRDDRTVIRRYSHLALIAWIALAASGVWALSTRMNSPGEILTSAYVQLALAKSMLLLVLGLIGAQQRRVLADRSGAAAAPMVPYRRLAALELALMTLAIALGAAMSSSPPPADPTPPPGSPSEVLSGYPLPPAPDLTGVLGSWRPDPFVIAVGVFLLLWWWRPAAPQRPRDASVRLVAGVLIAILVAGGPLAVYAKVLVSAHLLLHVLLWVTAGPLIASAIPPPAPLRALGRRAPWALPLVAAAPVALLAAVYLRQGVVREVLEGHVGHLALMLGVLAGGAVSWWCIDQARRLGAVGGSPSARGSAVLPVVTVAVPVLALAGIALVPALGSTLIAADWFGATGRTWRMDALADQRDGGWAVLAIAVAQAVVLTAMLLRDRRDRRPAR